MRASRKRLELDRLEERLVLDSAISEAQKLSLLGGLQDLATWGNRLAQFDALDRRLAGMDAELGEVAPVGDLFLSRLVQPVVDYFGTDATPTVEELTARLDSLPDTTGPVLGVVDPVANRMSFGFVFDARSTSQRPLELGPGAAELGLSIPSAPGLTVNSLSHWNLTLNIALDTSEFTLGLKADDPARVNAAVSARDLGFTVQFANPSEARTVVGGLLDLTATASIRFLNHSGTGRLTRTDLTSGDLAATFATETTGSYSSSLPLNAPLTGFASLGAATVESRATRVFAPAVPAVGLSVALPEDVQAALLTLLNEVEQVAAVIDAAPELTRSLPILGATLQQVSRPGGGDQAAMGDLLRYLNISQTYFGTAAPNASEWLAQLSIRANQLLGEADGPLAQGAFHVQGGLDPTERRLEFTLTYDASSSVSHRLDLGAEARELFNLVPHSNALVPAELERRMALTLGLDLDSRLAGQGLRDQDAHFRLDEFSVDVEVQPLPRSLGLDVGFLQTEIVGGILDLDVDANLLVAKPGGDRQISLADLAATPVGLFTQFSAHGEAAADLPLSAALGDFQLPPGARVGLVAPAIFTAPPSLSLQQFAALEPYQDMAATEVLAQLDQLGNWLDRFEVSGALDTVAPFTSTSLAELTDLGGSFGRRVLDRLKSDPADPFYTPTFRTAQELESQLALALGLEVAAVDARYNPETRELTYRVEWSDSAAARTSPLDLDFALSPLSRLDAAPDVNLISTASAGLTLGISLSRDGAARPTLATNNHAFIPIDGRLDGDARFTARIDGGPIVDVLVTSASTSSNSTLDDLAADINDSFTSAGVGSRVRVRADLGRLVFETIGADEGLPLDLLTSLADPAATRLGIAADGRLRHDARFQIQTAGRPITPVVVSAASTAANADMLALVADFTAALAAAGLGDVVVVNAIENRLSFAIRDVDDGAFLRLLTEDGDPLQTVFGLEATQTARLVAPGNLFVEQAELVNQIAVSLPSFQSGAAFGPFLGIEVGQGTVSGAETLRTRVKNPVTGVVGGRALLSELFANLDTANDRDRIAATTITGDAELTLGQIQVVDGFLDSVPGNPTIRYRVADPANPTGVQVATSDTAALDRFRSLRREDVLRAFSDLKSFLTASTQVGDLGRKLPMLEQSIAELVGYDARFGGVLDGLAATVTRTVQELEEQLKEVLNLPPTSNAVTVRLDGNLLRFEIDFVPASMNDTKALNVDLPGLSPLAQGGTPAGLQGVSRLVGIGGSAQLAVNASSDFHLEFGIDLTNPQSPLAFLDDDTRWGLRARANATDLTFRAGVGPLGLFVRGGSASLTSENSTASPAIYTISMFPSPTGRYSFTEDVTARLRSFVNGKATTSLPIFFPTDSLPIGNPNVLTLTVPRLGPMFQGANGAVQITTPDISVKLSDLGDIENLLKNSAVFQDGLNAGFDFIQGLVTSKLKDVKLPLIGSAADRATKLFDKFQKKLIKKVQEKIAEGAADTVEAVKQAFFEILGLEENLLAKEDGTPATSPDDVQTVKLPDRVSFKVRLKKTATPLSEHFGFDIGLPGLGLEVEAGVQVDVGFDMQFRMGVDRTEGFFIETDRLNEIQVGLIVTAGGLNARGQLGFFQIDVKDSPTKPSVFSAGLNIDLREPSGDQILTFNEIQSGVRLQDLVKVEISAFTDVNLAMAVSFNGDADFPRLAADFHLGWQFIPQNDPELDGEKPVIEFNNVRLEFGSFISKFVSPILRRIDEILGPIKPAIELLTKPLPVISNFFGKPTSLLNLMAIFADAEEAEDFIDAFQYTMRLIRSIPAEENLVILFGSFNLGNADARTLVDTTTVDPNQFIEEEDPLAQLRRQGATTRMVQFATDLNATGGDFDFEFPILGASGADLAFRLLLGQDVDLFKLTMTPFTVSFDMRAIFPIVGPIVATLSGTVGASFGAAFGFDTAGLFDFARTGNVKDVFNGFYLDHKLTTASLFAGLTAGAGLHFGFGGGGVEGGVFAELKARLNDPNKDGKVRFQEIVDVLEADPLCLFELTGEITASLFAWIEVLGTTKRFRLVPPITLLSFDVFECPEPEPVLATLIGDGVLRLNVGPNAASRIRRNTTDGDEVVIVNHVSGSAGGETVEVSAFGVSQRFSGVRKIVADGGQGNDRIELQGVLAEADVAGGAGNDILIGATGGGRFDGGRGNDSLSVAAGPWRLQGGPGQNTLSGAAGVLVTETLDTNFTLADSLLVMEGFGQDTLIGIRQAHLLGGAGPNTYVVSDWTGTARLEGLGGNDVVASANDANFTLADASLTRSTGGSFDLVNIGRAELTGGIADNLFTFTGWNGAGVIDGGIGFDRAVITGGTIATAVMTFPNVEKVEVRGGTLDVTGDVVFPRLDLVSGQILGPRTLTVDQTLTWTGGLMGGTGVTLIATQAILSIEGAGRKDLTERILRNAGSVSWIGTGPLFAGLGARIENLADALVNLRAEARINALPGGPIAEIVNDGVFVKAPNTIANAVNSFVIEIGFLNRNLVQVARSGFTISSNSLFLAGPFRNFVNQTLTGGRYLVQGTLQWVNAANWTNAADLVLDGLNGVTGPNLRNELNADLLRTILGNAPTGRLTLLNGHHYAPSRDFANQGEFLVENSSGLNLRDVTFTNTGRIQWNSTRSLASATATLNNLPAGVFEFSTDAGITILSSIAGRLAFNNEGVVRKAVGVGESALDAFFNHRGGTIEVRTGRLRLVNSTTGNGGRFIVDAGATLDLIGGGTHTFSGTYIGTGLGRIFHQGILTIGAGGAVFDFAPELYQWVGGSLAGQTLTNARMITVAADGLKRFQGGAIINQGTFDIIGPATLSATQSTFTNQTGAVLNFKADGDLSFVANVAGRLNLVNHGEIRKPDGVGTSFIDATLTNHGTLISESGTLLLRSGGGPSGGRFETAPGAVIDFNNGTYTLGDARFLGAGTTRLSGGALDVVAGRVAVVEGRFEQTAGTLQGAGTFQVDGRVDWLGGSMTGVGVTTISALGQFVLQGGGAKSASTRTFRNEGLLALEGTGPWQCANVLLENLPSGVMELRSTAGVTLIPNVAGRMTLNNRGTIRKLGDAGTSSILALFTNTGLVDSQLGTLQLEPSQLATSVSTGRFEAGPAGILAIIGSSNRSILLGDGAVFRGAGLIRLVDSVLDVTAGSTARMEGRFEQVGGRVDGPGTFEVSGRMTWLGGSMVGVGTTSIAAGGELVLQGAGAKSANTRTFRNAGLLALEGTGPWQCANVLLENLPSGVMELRSTAGVTLIPNVAGRMTLNNRGTIRKLGDAGTSSILALFTNTGLVDSQLGTLQLEPSQLATSVSTGRFEAGPAGILAIIGSSNRSILLGDGALFQGGGLVRLVDSALDVVSGATARVLGRFEQSGGRVNGAGTLEVSGRMTWTGGSMNDAGTTVIAAGGELLLQGPASKTGNTRRFRNAGLIALEGTGHWMASNVLLENLAGGVMEFQSTAGVTFVPNVAGRMTLLNEGIVRKSAAGVTSLNAIFSNTGLLEVQAGRLEHANIVTNFDSPSKTLTGGRYHLRGEWLVPGSEVRTLAAEVVLDGAAGAMVASAGVDALRNLQTIGSQGRLGVTGGRTLSLSNPLVNQGVAHVGPGGTLTTSQVYRQSASTASTILQEGTLGAAQGLDLQAGLLQGFGVVNAPITSAGVLDPTGRLEIRGALTTLAGSRLEARLAGTNLGEFDQLVVFGAVTLNAALGLEVAFPSNEGDRFPLIDNDGVEVAQGSFAGLAEGATITIDGNVFQLTYVGGDGNDVVLTRNAPAMVRDLALSATTIVEGEVVRLTGALVDNDGSDDLTLIVDWGDGSIERYRPGRDRFEIPHRYVGDAGTPSTPMRVRVTWFDEFNAGRGRELAVTVANAPPRADLGASVRVRPGQSFRRVGYVVDPGGDRVRAFVSYGGDRYRAVAVDRDGSIRLRATYRRPGDYQVRVRVVDHQGAQSVSILNVVVRRGAAGPRIGRALD